MWNKKRIHKKKILNIPPKKYINLLMGTPSNSQERETTGEITLKETPWNLTNFWFLYLDKKTQLKLYPKLLHAGEHRFGISQKT